jgi:nitroreductase
MDVEEAIRTRRTHKAFDPEPLTREEVDDLLALATWAPNHHLTNPWRFRVIGPATRERLKEIAGPIDGRKLDRAPTLVAVSAAGHEDPVQDQEDQWATAAAAYAVLLAAHGRGYATYWRTPALLREEPGRAALGIGPEETVIGLLHLGRPRQEQRPPEKAPLEDVVEHLP